MGGVSAYTHLQTFERPAGLRAGVVGPSVSQCSWGLGAPGTEARNVGCWTLNHGRTCSPFLWPKEPAPSWRLQSAAVPAGQCHAALRLKRFLGGGAAWMQTAPCSLQTPSFPQRQRETIMQKLRAIAEDSYLKVQFSDKLGQNRK